MKFSTIVASIAVSVACLASTPVHAANDWSYASPAEWAAKYPVCGASKSQSPIDITVADSTKVTAPLIFTGSCSSYKISQEYDAFTATVQGGSCGVSLNGKAYALSATKLRVPAEHSINGEVRDGELQFIHKGSNGKTAVVSLILRVNDFLPTKTYVANFWTGIKANSTITANLGSFYSLITDRTTNGRVFNYQGSLTTPACEENVDWWVVETPLSVKTADFKKLQTELPRVAASNAGKNSRPVQALNGRKIAVY